MKDDGGPAFPHGPLGDTMHGEDGRISHQCQAYPGMSLRDWFAGMATDADVQVWLDLPGVASRRDARYMHADAMIGAREKP